MIRCACGIEERACLREQARAESNEPCLDRRSFYCCECGEEPDERGLVICEDCERKARTPDVFVYTDAPVAYDYWYTTQVKDRAGIDTRGTVWRCVRMAPDRAEAQSARYRSGWHAAMPPRDWQRALIAGVVYVPGGAS